MCCQEGLAKLSFYHVLIACLQAEIDTGESSRYVRKSRISKFTFVGGAFSCGCLFLLASFPGPAQLSVASSTEKRFFVRARGEPGNEAIFLYGYL